MGGQPVQTSTNIAKYRKNDVRLRLSRLNEKLNTWRYTHRSSLYLHFILHDLDLFKTNIEELSCKRKTCFCNFISLTNYQNERVNSYYTRLDFHPSHQHTRGSEHVHLRQMVIGTKAPAAVPGTSGNTRHVLKGASGAPYHHST